MTGKQNKIHACDICGAYDCNGDDCRLYQEYEKLKHENYELAEEVSIDRALFAEIDKLKSERDSYIDKYFLESQKVINLKKVLTEIKEILLFHKEELEECLHNDIDGQILQKISEV